MAGPGKQYVIGKGRLSFDAFEPGTKTKTGERYLGNSPELTANKTTDTLDHFDADQGMNIKDESITITNDLGGGFKLDSIEPANVAMWFGGDIEKATIVAATAVAEPDFVAMRGRHYQLGATDDSPSGTRAVTNITVSTVVPGATPSDPVVVTAISSGNIAANVDFDLENASIYIEPDAPLIANGTTLRVVYDQEGVTRTTIIEKGQEVRGALRLRGKNPVGDTKHFYWPYVKVTANGDFALKGDTWQEMSFTYEVLKLDSATERLYVDEIPATV